MRKDVCMPLRFWRPSLSGRAAANKLVASVALLALVVVTLATSLLFTRHAAAAAAQPQTRVSVQAQSGTPRLGVFQISQGVVYYQWSDNSGATWSSWTAVPGQPQFPSFVGTPSAVSDGAGDLTVFARDSSGGYEFNEYFHGAWGGQWFRPFVFGGTPISDPVITSWGLGRLDLFYNVTVQTGSSPWLEHVFYSSAVGAWSTIEVLSTGGPTSLAAVSWGPGRIDVFGRGANNELEHKWFDNGQWSSGWENLGGILTSNPATTSLGAGRLDVFARGTDGHVWDKWFSSGGWSSWVDRGCCLAGDVASSVAVTSPMPGSLSLFVIDTLHDLYRKPFTDGVGYGDWQFIDHAFDYTNIAAAAWTPATPAPTPTPTPTPPPTPRGGCFVSCP
jgi:hypothetical protein